MFKKVIVATALLVLALPFGLWFYRHHHGKLASRNVMRPMPAHTAVAQRPVAYKAKLLFMGDVMLARTIGSQIKAGANPFKYVQKTLDGYDFRVINLETTMASPAVAIQAKHKLFTFNAPLNGLGVLKTAHIDLAGLANNHTRDFGPSATADMLDQLAKADIPTAGAGKNLAQAFRPSIVNVPMHSGPGQTAKLRLAVVAVNSIENNFTNVTNSAAGSAYFDTALVGREIKLAKQKADVVVVFPHWGVEYQTTPTAYQKQWGHFFIDHGADIVIGSHPHVVQPTEKYHGHYIIYSMGNFIFDEMTGLAAKGQMVGLDLSMQMNDPYKDTHTKSTTKIAKPKLIPTILGPDGFPHLP